MVHKKRPGNRSNGFQVPIIPRAPRSARRRGPNEKSGDGVNVCAIELLASLAGKLLQETESSASNTASEESTRPVIHNKLLKSEEQGSCAEGFFGSEQASENNQLKDSTKRSPEVESDTLYDCSSVFTSSACSEKENGRAEPCLKDSMELDRKDDDEKISRFDPSIPNKPKPYKPVNRMVDRRIRKILTSKHWNRAPQLKDIELSKSDRGRKVLNQKRRIFYSRERYHREFLHKRRKMLDGCCTVTSDGVLSSESDSSFPQTGINGVKFSIKSFKIPELFVDAPESATVGSLKRTIMEAVTTILGRGLRVGVLLQGKKIRDDNRTLLQAGISCKENLDTLGFMLEPNLTQTPPAPRSIAPEDSDSPCTLPWNIPQQQQLTTGCTEEPISDTKNSDSDATNLTVMCDNSVDNSGEIIVSSNPDIPTDKESRAIVPLAETNPEPLAIVPVGQKNKRSELSQRRIRRPFSVSEVEALVQAVEELGTGRWRDVKLRAFENADHRTYVDLKDKWKTLVHTASIGPQQRRGEPVPQDLLDRVLAAHSYWSQNQSKQNSKANLAVDSLLNMTNGPDRCIGV